MTKEKQSRSPRKNKTVVMDESLYNRLADAALRKFGRTARHPGPITRGFEEAIQNWLACEE